MSITQIEIQLIAIVVAAACALPGVFLVLRGMAMMSDAISHTVLLGIVLAFFVTQDLDSPFLILGAAAMGVVTVSLIEMLSRSRLVKYDAAIGLVFPALFSIAVILISRFARGVHLDIDAVLLGELAFAPFERFAIVGIDIPRSLAMMGGILLLNVVFITLFYKELKLATFDAGLAAALGFSPVFIHYALMALVSITTVGAFEAVGSILVVALMITPAASAYLLTNKLRNMLIYSVIIGALSAVGGYWAARALDANIAGAMATMTGLLFMVAFLLAPTRGIVAVSRRQRRQRWEFSQTMLAIHLLNHEGKPEADDESRVDHLWRHLRWRPDFAAKVVQYSVNKGTVKLETDHLLLTDEGRRLAHKAMVG